MPHFPHVSPSIQSMRGGVFSKLAHHIAAIEGERYPLHVGDTWMEPMVGARMQDFRVEDHPGMHRYSVPHGHPALLQAIEARAGVARDQILVTAGATGGLSAVAGVLLEPGDEVIILAPYWPLIRGIVESARGVPVELPVFAKANRDLTEALLGAITERTVAIYVNTPNNPTGKVLSGETLASIADIAAANDLWIWSDEVYEPYVFSGEHIPMHTLAPHRTFAAYSFSKAYGMAGNRVGYLVGPPAVMAEVRKVSTHSFYSAPTAAQLAATVALLQGDQWVANAKAAYAEAGRAAADRLGVPPPEGGTFLFLDISEHLDDRGLDGFLLDCIDRNLLLAPGVSCGRIYGDHVRLCFTSAPPDVVARGVEQLAQLLGR